MNEKREVFRFSVFVNDLYINSAYYNNMSIMTLSTTKKFVRLNLYK